VPVLCRLAGGGGEDDERSVVVVMLAKDRERDCSKRRGEVRPSMDGGDW
jgi:hypothetical protein